MYVLNRKKFHDQISSQPTEPKAVGIWIRVSTDDQAKGESPEHHLERARAYAKARGWEVKEVYDLAGLKGWSGKTVKDHPEAKRMLTDIKSGHITGLIFSKLARLARNTKELLEFADYFREHHADLISIAETIDTSSPAGRLFFTIIAAMAQWEREEIADRVKASLAVRAKLGKPLSGVALTVTIGKTSNSSSTPNRPPSANWLMNSSCNTAARGLSPESSTKPGTAPVRVPGGATWPLDASCAAPAPKESTPQPHPQNRTLEMGGKARERMGRRAVEPIVSKTLWNQCNQILEEQQKTKKPGKTPVRLFAGMAVCDCGQRMYVNGKAQNTSAANAATKSPLSIWKPSSMRN